MQTYQMEYSDPIPQGWRWNLTARVVYANCQSNWHAYKCLSGSRHCILNEGSLFDCTSAPHFNVTTFSFWVDNVRIIQLACFNSTIWILLFLSSNTFPTYHEILCIQTCLQYKNVPFASLFILIIQLLIIYQFYLLCCLTVHM